MHVIMPKKGLQRRTLAVFSVKSAIQSFAMNLFSTLRAHARTCPGTIAVSSRFRETTYRKLWSRVERATARLQGEWHLLPGERLGYFGPAHPDALVAYIAAMRCGAQFVPLEAEAAQSCAALVFQELGVRMVLREDACAFAPASPSARVEPLSALIGTRCPYRPTDLLEDMAHPGLIRATVAADGALRHRGYTLADLTAGMAEAGTRPGRVAGGLFDAPDLERMVLPTLAAGGTLVLP